jgi:hypothetical protein
MKNFFANAFHILGIVFFVIVLWILLELTGVAGAFRGTWNVMQNAGH